MHFRPCTFALVLAASLVAVPAGAQPMDSTALLLQQVIRVNTANPPGRTQALAELLAPMFKARGFTVEIVPTPDSAKVHFFARLKGSGAKKPILLAAHADVVGVEREKWTVEPFDGVVKDGDVYGRGAIDFKGGLAVFARAAMLLADRKVPLDRDIIFLAEADEEGMPLNTSWLARTHWDRMDAEFSLNEGGWIIKRDDGKVRYVSISTADKVSTMFKLVSKGTSTHASMPLPDNALVTVGKALAKLAAFDFPVELTAEQRQYFTALAKSSGPAEAKLYRDLLSGTPTARAAADRQLSKDPLLHSLIRTTIAPVIMSWRLPLQRDSRIGRGAAQRAANSGYGHEEGGGGAHAAVQRSAADRGPARQHAGRAAVVDRDGVVPGAGGRVEDAVAGGGGHAVPVPGRNGCRRVAYAWRAGVWHLPVPDHDGRAQAHARQRREGEHRVVAAGHGDDLSHAGARGGEALR